MKNCPVLALTLPLERALLLELALLSALAIAPLSSNAAEIESNGGDASAEPAILQTDSLDSPIREISASPAVSFVESLGQLKLYRLARIDIEMQLAQPGLSASKEAALTADWIKSAADESMSLPVEQQATLWKQALDRSADFLARRPGSPYGVLVQFAILDQQIRLARLSALTSQLFPESQIHRETTLRQLRTSLETARSLEQILANPANANNPVDGPSASASRAFTEPQWSTLKNRASLQAAIILTIQAGQYPESSPERADGFAQALERLKLLGGLPNSDPLFWQARLERVRALRLSGDWTMAWQATQFMLEKQSPPDALKLDFQAELLLILFQTNREKGVELMNQLLEKNPEQFLAAGSRDDALNRAVMDCQAILWREALTRNDTEGQKQFQSSTLEWADKMARFDSSYNALTARQTLAALAESVTAQAMGPGVASGKETNVDPSSGGPDGSDGLDSSDGSANSGNLAHNSDSAAPRTGSEFNSGPNSGSGSNSGSGPHSATGLGSGSRSAESVQLLIVAAENAYRSGRWSEAMRGYENAARVTARNGDATAQNDAFKLQYTAAAIAHKLKDHRLAADKFRAVALAFPSHPQAAAAHKTALFHAAAELKSAASLSPESNSSSGPASNSASQPATDTVRQAPLVRYRSWLDEHLTMFENSSPYYWEIANQRIKVAQLERDDNKIVSLCRQLVDDPTVRNDAQRFEPIFKTALDAMARQLSDIKVQGRDASSLTNQYCSWLYKTAGIPELPDVPASQIVGMASPLNDPPNNIDNINSRDSALWTRTARETIVKIAVWKAQYCRQGDLAVKILESALKTNAADSAETADSTETGSSASERTTWRANTTATLIALLVSQNRMDEALEKTNQLAGAGANQLNSLVEALGSRVDKLPEAERKSAAQAVLKTIELLNRQSGADPKAGAAPANLDIQTADMLFHAGDYQQSVILYEKLAKKYPNSGPVQIGFARALTGLADSTKSYSRALQQWRTIADHSKQYSDYWYEAKTEIVRLLTASGQRKQAIDMVRVLKLVRPDLGGPRWKEKFEIPQ